MTTTHRRRLTRAWSAVVVAILACGLLVGPLGPRSDRLPATSGLTTGGLVALILFMALLAALLLVRRPRNRIGWVFGALVSLLAAAFFLDAYVVASFAGGLPPLPAATFVAWLNLWLPSGLWLVIALLLLLFPDGALPSRRWRPVAGATVAFYGASMVLWMFSPGPMAEHAPANPVGWDALGSIAGLTAAFWPLSMLLMVVSAASLLVRYRAATGVQRQQLKWLALSGLLVTCGGATMLAAGAAVGDGALETPVAVAASVVVGAGFISVPLFAVLAILRYRLYEIDHIISRTVAYAVLTGVLVAVYIGAVALVSPVAASLGGDSNMAVAAATLAVAAAFQPARRRVQSVVDRRFNRARYDAERIIRSFAERLREPVDVDDVRDDLLATAAGVVHPTRAFVWVAGPDQGGGNG